MAHDTHSRDGDVHGHQRVSAGHGCGADRVVLRPVGGPVLEGGAQGVHGELQQPANPAGGEIPEGDMRCTGECGGNPTDYEEDYGVRCPDCLGLGHRADPDLYDASDAFDPYTEFNTMPRLYGRGRGQL
jgi:hypothetical protein